MRFVVAAIVLLTSAQTALVAGDDLVIDRAVTALRQGDLSSAEQLLQRQLTSQPRDTGALELLAVVLDQEKKYEQADPVYRRALSLDSHSPQLLNNFGNHLLATGKDKQARQVFLQVLAADPNHANARVQLARLAIQAKAPVEAAGYLEHLPPDVQRRPDVEILRMQTEYASGKNSQGDVLLKDLSSASPAQDFALAKALSAVGQYAAAEDLFAKTLEAEPSNFDALYDLGLAASHAGHNGRAQEVLAKALQLQPQNPDVLYDLAAVDIALNQKEAGLELLARAHGIVPERADIDAALARTSGSLGDFADSVKAWEDYLKLRPTDADAIREHAFEQTALGQSEQHAVAELKTYVRLHPRDAAGLYELGVAEASSDPAEAKRLFDRAIAAKQGYAPARFARGLLLYRTGHANEALADFQVAAESEPDDPTVLDREGETLVALGRLQEAIPLLRKAAALSPRNPTILLHLGHALTQSHQDSEAAAIFAQYLQLGPAKSQLPQPVGFVDFLSLSPAEQQSRYRAGLERTLKQDPNNAEAQVRYLGVLLQERDFSDAAQSVSALQGAKPNLALLREAVSELLTAQQYALAQTLLQSTLANDAPPDLQLALAVATFHTDGPRRSLELMKSIPAADRSADYQLALAQMLEADGDDAGAQAAIQTAVQANPSDPQFCQQAALVLLVHNHPATAGALLSRCDRAAPGHPEIELLHAISLAANGENAGPEFNRIEDHWPEWTDAWAADASMLELRHEHEAARQKLQAAMEIAHDSAAAYYCLAEIDLDSTPPQIDAARRAAESAHNLLPGNAIVEAMVTRLKQSDPQPIAPGEFEPDILQLLFQ